MKTKWACIVAGGSLNDAFLLDRMEQERYDITIAVDRGLEFFYRNGLCPDYAVGDFDSVSPEALAYYDAFALSGQMRGTYGEVERVGGSGEADGMAGAGGMAGADDSGEADSLDKADGSGEAGGCLARADDSGEAGSMARVDGSGEADGMAGAGSMARADGFGEAGGLAGADALTGMAGSERKVPRMVRLHRIKDDTDTEHALQIALGLSCDPIHIYGGTGSRVDHLLGNLQLLGYGLRAGRECMLIDEKNRIRLISGETLLQKDQQFGDYVSLIPYTPKVTGLTLEGFLYPLRDHTMSGFYLDGAAPVSGISNEIVADTARISFREGILVLVEAKD